MIVWKFILSLVISYLVIIGLPDAKVELIIEKLILSTVSVLVGISIAVTGIFLGSINSLYIQLYKLIKDQGMMEGNYFNDDEIYSIRDNLNDVVEELKDNSIFSLIALFATVIFYVVGQIDFPYLIWFIEISILSKKVIINTLITASMILIFISIYDSLKAVFKINNIFTLNKK